MRQAPVRCDRTKAVHHGLIAAAFAFGLAASPACAQAPELTDCDRLAAAGYDENATGEPVTWIVLRRTADAATVACRAAVETYPDVPRFRYQLARALDAAKQFEEAATLYAGVVDEAYAAAMAELAVLYIEGKGVTADPAKGFELASRSADLGNAHGMTVQAFLFASGVGTTADQAKAFELFQAAAEQGHGEAMEYLGGIYRSGAGVAANEAAALKWYQQAAGKGRVRAAVAAGQLLQRGPQTRMQAKSWLALAARAGDPVGMRILAGSLLAGDGAGPDRDGAVMWLERAAAAGDVDSFAVLGQLNEATGSDAGNPALARQWYERGVEAGDPISAFFLARGYDRGEFGDKPALAIDYLVYSALSGYRPAVSALAAGIPQEWNIETRKALQAKLAEEGLYTGAMDGVSGPGTLKAVQEFLTR